MADEVLTEVRGRVLVMTLNRPEAMNSVNTALAQALLAAIERLDSDNDLTLGVLTGAGRGFSAGMDLKAFATEGPPVGFHDFIEQGAQKPLIAAIEGFALAGGLEIALTCDLLVGSADSKFGIPETGVGLFAAAGGLMRLPRRVPYGVAMEMALTAQPIDAPTALSLRLIDRMAEPGSSLDEAMDLAEKVAANAPLAVKASKQVMHNSTGLTEEEFWEMQRPFLREVFASDDSKEGPAAFAQKRKPQWTGH